MSSTFGNIFCITNFGESHGPAIGCVIDGCPPGMPLAESDLQHDLDRRKSLERGALPPPTALVRLIAQGTDHNCAAIDSHDSRSIADRVDGEARLIASKPHSVAAVEIVAAS